MRNHLLPPFLLLCAGLAGCAETTGFPSLAPRPIEREVLRAEAVPPVPAPAEAAPIPASAEIAEIVARALAADAAFKAELERARPLIEAGRNAPEGSEAWVAGQQAYSAADASSAPVAEALGELDRRREAAADAGDGATEAAITDALVQLQALYEAQRAQLAALMPA
ncbi:hypothetical protein [Rhizorhabdus dicambivorans]|uniref:hypothetical protein n=1 Tax=Rhizorhabdus dicambivorans TaxID=1850238 RepID=UPI00082B5A91|nr:hypothetical protein [Rhizorhabdus dicambivorans]